MKRGESMSVMATEVETLVRDKVREVRGRGGKVVGLVGFSQGTKVVAGLLKGVEIRRAVGGDAGSDDDWLDFSFALSVCGSYPPPLIPQCATALLASSSAAALSDQEKKEIAEKRIQIPTLHVQGTQDEWHWAGENLIQTHYEVGEGKSEVVEWEMGHYYPVPVEHNEMMKDWLVGQLERVEGRGREKSLV